MDEVKIKSQNKTSSTPAKPDREPSPAPAGSAQQDWLQPLEAMLQFALKNEGPDKANLLVCDLISRLHTAGVQVPRPVGTPYINTISTKDEPPYPGNREVERRIKSLARWNAM